MLGPVRSTAGCCSCMQLSVSTVEPDAGKETGQRDWYWQNLPGARHLAPLGLSSTISRLGAAGPPAALFSVSGAPVMAWALPSSRIAARGPARLATQHAPRGNFARSQQDASTSRCSGRSLPAGLGLPIRHELRKKHAAAAHPLGASGASVGAHRARCGAQPSPSAPPLDIGTPPSTSFLCPRPASRPSTGDRVNPRHRLCATDGYL